MINIGDHVVYNEDGVCCVENIGVLKIATASRDQQYYTLRPVFGDGRIYVPVDTALPLRPVMTREEAMALIYHMPEIEAEVCRLNSKRVLEEHYRNMMKSHTPEALVCTLKSIYAKRHGGEKVRALSNTDEYYRKRAEALLHQELSVALEIPVEEVEKYIIHTIEAGA